MSEDQKTVRVNDLQTKIIISWIHWNYIILIHFIPKIFEFWRPSRIILAFHFQQFKYQNTFLIIYVQKDISTVEAVSHVFDQFHAKAYQKLQWLSHSFVWIQFRMNSYCIIIFIPLSKIQTIRIFSSLFFTKVLFAWNAMICSIHFVPQIIESKCCFQIKNLKSLNNLIMATSYFLVRWFICDHIIRIRWPKISA